MNKAVVMTSLFPVGCRMGMAATFLLALTALPVSPAPLSAKVLVQASGKAATPSQQRSGKAAPAARTATKPKAKSKPKTKTAVAPKPADAVPVPDPERSEAARRVIAWVASEHDNGALPYIVIDKQAASLSLFTADGQFIGETPVLLGIGVGDDSSPGVGAKNLSDIGPAERTTPAGRFVAKFGRAFGQQRVLWVDYANSVALHAVITTHKQEHRVARLLSPTPDDNRISFGCINVGTRFYTKQLRPLLLKKGGVVYILPDSKPLDTVFPRVRLLPYLNGAAAG
ncbi:hypothetical protein [Sphingomonas sp. CARO-RG-8B-R24-01]|uniref:hypothetical protein n=1 Tax=Sphingomonas sp. CARO-RG-8B-R24-01 TaxID=2914831 RepID=UPI001F563479